MSGAGLGLYVHVPFCVSRCGYCSFYSSVRNDAVVPKYLSDLHQSLRMWSGISPSSVYVGGGTPTALAAQDLGALLGFLRSEMDLSSITEFTVEANPATLTDEMVAVLVESGVTRVSLGAQSMETRALELAGRQHGVPEVVSALGRLRRGGVARVGLDLIAGLPGSTRERWTASLGELVELGADHLSVYALSIEPDTEFDNLVSNGVLVVPDEDAVLGMLDETEGVLPAGGFQQYEISNYARNGAVCEHNLAVWRGGDYLGVGPGASSRIGRERWTNTMHLHGWERAEWEVLPEETDLSERLMFGVRLNEGVSLQEFGRRFDCPSETLVVWEQSLVEMVEEGVLCLDDERWRLTRRGRRVADSVAARLLQG